VRGPRRARLRNRTGLISGWKTLPALLALRRQPGRVAACSCDPDHQDWVRCADLTEREVDRRCEPETC
jgi:hypothetical protein